MHFNCADFSGAEQEPIHLPLQQQKVVIFYGQKQQSPSHLHSHPYQQISFFKYWLFFSHYFFLMTCCPHVCDGVHALACIVCKCMCVCARALRVCVYVCVRARVLACACITWEDVSDYRLHCVVSQCCCGQINFVQRHQRRLCSRVCITTKTTTAIISSIRQCVTGPGVDIVSYP